MEPFVKHGLFSFPRLSTTDLWLLVLFEIIIDRGFDFVFLYGLISCSGGFREKVAYKLVQNTTTINKTVIMIKNRDGENLKMTAND